MRLHRFFITNTIDGRGELVIHDVDVIHQWKNVFRLKAGDRVILLDNSGLEYVSEIGLLTKEKAEVKILESKRVENVPEKEVWLYAALIKKDNFEWILEKATEIGVAKIVPVVSERSEKKNLNMERAEKIVKEASEQSGRGMIPEVREPIDLEDALNEGGVSFVAFHTTGEKFDRTLLGSNPTQTLPEGKGSPLLRRGASLPAGRQGGEVRNETNFETQMALGLLIGPEGGWSDAEVELFKTKNIPIYSIGPQVLRAETAAIVISALVLFG